MIEVDLICCVCGQGYRLKTKRCTRLTCSKKCAYELKSINLNKKRKDVTGFVFGKLTIICEDGRLHGKVAYKCQCECGIIKRIANYDLFGKNKKYPTVSCGCNNPSKKTGPKSIQWRGTENISGSYYDGIKRGAENRKISFDIDINIMDDLLVSQNFKCALTGKQISVVEKTASLDRINSKIGYTVDNIQWVEKRINRLKNNFTENELFEMCYNLLNHRKLKAENELHQPNSS